MLKKTAFAALAFGLVSSHVGAGPDRDPVVARHDGRQQRRRQQAGGRVNASQKDYKVVPSYKGNYADTMNAGIAAFRAGNAPHISRSSRSAPPR
jgi:sn-glycerol 3-phosphate transport system substrate-binding protein